MSTTTANEPSCKGTEDRDIDLVIEGRPRGVDSITVARLLPSPKRRMIGPFIFVDHMGPVTIPPGVGFDVRPHPHIGLSTVTYFFAGENVHRDSLGNERTNRPGDVNLMTAGGGIVHSERAAQEFRASGGEMHGVQIWVALPEAHEDDAPSFEHHPEATLPTIAPATGVSGRVLIGTAFGASSPIRHPSKPLLVELRLEAGASVELPSNVAERGVFVVKGAVRVGAEVLSTNQLGVLCGQRAVSITATEPTHAMLLGGATHSPRFIEWNFVASSRERIERARDRWKARQFPVIPGDDKDFIPWPENLR